MYESDGTVSGFVAKIWQDPNARSDAFCAAVVLEGVGVWYAIEMDKHVLYLGSRIQGSEAKSWQDLAGSRCWSWVFVALLCRDIFASNVFCSWHKREPNWFSIEAVAFAGWGPKNCLEPGARYGFLWHYCTGMLWILSECKTSSYTCSLLM